MTVHQKVEKLLTDTEFYLSHLKIKIRKDRQKLLLEFNDHPCLDGYPAGVVDW